MITLLANIIGGALAMVFVGYFAYSVDKTPLTIIVIGCLVLMIFALYKETRENMNGG